MNNQHDTASNNTMQDNDVGETTKPTFRSVQLVAPAPLVSTSMTTRSSSGLDKERYLSATVMATTQTLTNKQDVSSSSSLFHQSTFATPSTVSETNKPFHNIENNTSNNKTTMMTALRTLTPCHNCWSTKTHQLPRMGFYHPHAPTQVSLPASRLENDLVLDQLNDCFRNLSCHVTFAEKTLAAQCRTTEQVIFQVSLYESRTDPSTIIVEFQRQWGDAYCFHQDYARPIMAVLREDDQQGEPTMAQPYDQHHKLSRALRRLLPAVSVDEMQRDVSIATELLFQNRWDARRLGLESLVIMTQPNHCCRRYLTERLVHPTTEQDQALSRQLLHFCHHRHNQPSNNIHDHLPSLALHVWANIWQTVVENQMTVSSEFEQEVCPMARLVEQLGSFVHANNDDNDDNQPIYDPHCAMYAMRILTAMDQSLKQQQHRSLSVSVISWPTHAVIEHCATRCGTTTPMVLTHAAGAFLQQHEYQSPKNPAA